MVPEHRSGTQSLTNMKKISLLLLPLLLIGCESVGNAPTGGSEEESKRVFDAQPLEAKVQFYMNSPMPLEDKKKKIEELYQKEGKPMPDNIFSGGASNGPPGGTGQTR